MEQPSVLLDTSSPELLHPDPSTSDQDSVGIQVVRDSLSPPSIEHSRVDDHETRTNELVVPDDQDIVNSIKGMYRILDLVSEQGSGGLVEKIIIAQESLGRFINDVCPRAYTSMIKVDFTTLDRHDIKPLGIYGSRSEIIRYLRDEEAIDDRTASMLRSSEDDTGAVLRAGIYILRPISGDVFSVIFWPEETTWNDDATSAIQRNRVTFMRYLTKICAQVVALISDEDASKIVWKETTSRKDEEEEVDPIDRDIQDVDRFFSFEVAKTKEQEENVTVRPGFTVSLPKSRKSQNEQCDAIDPRLLGPRLVPGETVVGYMDVQYTSSYHESKQFPERYSSVRLRKLIDEEAFVLSMDLPEDALQILLRHGLGAKRSPEAVHALRESRRAYQAQPEVNGMAAVEASRAHFEHIHPLLVQAIRSEIAKAALSEYSVTIQCAVGGIPTDQRDPDSKILLDQFFTEYSELLVFIKKASKSTAFTSIPNKSFKTKKNNLLKIKDNLSTKDHWTQQEQKELARTTEEPGGFNLSRITSNLWSLLTSPTSPTSPTSLLLRESSHQHADQNNDSEGVLGDAEALSQLETFFPRFPVFDNIMQDAFQLAVDHLTHILEEQTDQVVRHMDNLALRAYELGEDRVRDAFREQETDSRRKFLADVRDSYLTGSDEVYIIEDVWSIRDHQGFYNASGYLKSSIDESLVYKVYPFKITEHDTQALHMDPNFVPNPRLHSRSSFSFHTPLAERIRHVQLLQDDRCLLVVESESSVEIYLDEMNAIGKALERHTFKKRLNMGTNRIDFDFLLAFDESKRMLALCTKNKSTLNFYTFDERFTSCSGFGARIDLTSWYSDSKSLLTHIVFLCGPSEEELLLVDDNGYMRVFSLNTQQCRPASVTLPQPPVGLHSSPDGSCLFVAFNYGDTVSLKAYHWSAFGHTDGIPLELPSFPSHSHVMTSIGNRSKAYYIGLDDITRQCKAFALDITCKTAEFSFRERRKNHSRYNPFGQAIRNSLFDCHCDIWTRYPVVPAIRRSTSSVKSRSLTFVSSLDPTQCRNYFKNLISNFEQNSKKPTEQELSKMIVRGMTYEVFRVSENGATSSYSCGQWLVDLLCLIPIHIAVAWDNRFVPLKDGVWSREFDRSLLGATVEQIVDSLSFGWYESIFKSYMSSKPVRVVSSMGEQSVGKSFTLNHLVDTSFAGSAMRTTEGVWMSLTPTDDALLVALDFEGVHSLERSIQEDTLLVLFNTALSNLVLFRNNFALSRSIAGLFHSFQSSSTVLDPAASPTLFQSTLVIIIKDVIESDKEEIKKEFSLRFQKIVEEEKESNFITKLHNSELLIVPWPVIESREFYGLFRPLGKRLQAQPVTHAKGAMFLETMKTLMAKLKANDWGALDQNIASHRAQQLALYLPNAFACGMVETEPETEPLRDYDSGKLIDMPDSSAIFYVTRKDIRCEEQERVLTRLFSSFASFDQRFESDDRHWITMLQGHLDGRARERIARVHEWLRLNMARFQVEAESPLFEEVRRLSEDLTISLHSSIQICASQCANCQLCCLRPKYHEGIHNCSTNHSCIRLCEYAVDHSNDPVPCGLPAGHRGTHICDVSVHLCGKVCYQSGKYGCLHYCAKSVDHPDKVHDCLEPHECGEPCVLTNVRLADGSPFTCPQRCRKLIDEPHEVHTCNSQNCPVPCQLCKRMCSNPSHLHALQKNAVHLCGQEHPCLELCQYPGLCRIETTPQSIEETFTGKHETFQYTKYTQVAHRQPCAIAIPSDRLTHDGDHVHSTEQKPFHYCEARCGHCEYFCTLPLGHPQQEHETSHGSMSEAKWAISDSDGDGLEVNGRRFGANDGGAPMLCSMVCRQMGRHVHVDYCQAEDASTCSSAEREHINSSMDPHPDRAKDFISHALYWRRKGFKDPYSQEERTYYSKCDSMCPGPEHHPNTGTPSYCTLSIFHRPLTDSQRVPGGVGYISPDGHHFSCRKPMSEAYHIIFVIDRSGSMYHHDRRPLQDTPVTSRIAAWQNNRLGAVYSSLYGFWTARAASLNTTAGSLTTRRDAYSVILFNHVASQLIENDYARSPEGLLGAVLRHGPKGMTDYAAAIEAAQAVMVGNWSSERTPVVIFLSDGLGEISDATIRNLSNRAVTLGRPLSFHAISFGTYNETLRRMATIASDVQSASGLEPTRPTVPSSYIEASDTVQLAETFLGIAESLRKKRGALMRG